jgi:condensin-2 complex subunit D3
MRMVRDAVHALLARTGHGDENVPLDSMHNVFIDNQGDAMPSSELVLCQRLLKYLKQASPSRQGSSQKTSTSDTNDDTGDEHNEQYCLRTNLRDNAPTTLTIRSVLGNIPSSQITHLTTLLATMLADRVDSDQLLPSTQDVQANQDAMNETACAVTLTATSLTAAQIYAYLLTLPGALGAGFVDVSTLTALSALLRRWRTECCGREHQWNAQNRVEQSTDGDHPTLPGKRRGTQPTRLKIDDMLMASQPVKRSRQGALLTETEECWGEQAQLADNVDASQISLSDNPSDMALSPSQLINVGLQVAQQVACIPRSKEFLSWSQEARDAILDAVTSVLATAAALSTGKNSTNSTSKDLCQSVKVTAVESLEKCLLEHSSDEPTLTDDANDSDQLTRRHESAVAILRGLLPSMIMKDVLPKGEQGKFAAAAIASDTLEGFLERIVEDISVHPHRWPARMSADYRAATRSETRTTPSNSAKDCSLMNTPTTARRSLGESNGGERSNRRSSHGLTPPRLKTPAAAAQNHRGICTSSNGRPRPVISAILGILQRLATDKGLDKASSRTVATDILYRCVRHLPHLERAHFLKFLIRCCYSKISAHRLVACEVIGQALSETWLWSDHVTTEFQISSDPTTPNSVRRQSLSPLVTQSSADMPAALLAALQGRLMDRVPAIRTVAAQSFTLNFRKVSAEHETPSTGARGVSISAMGLVQSFADEAYTIANSLRQRAACDEKATVRRAAVGALVELLIMSNHFPDFSCLLHAEDIDILRELCRDSSMLTRKSSSEALTRLLEHCVSAEASTSLKSTSIVIDLEQAWVSSVLTMVLDSEQGCIGKAMELVDRVLFCPIMRSSDDDAESESLVSVWRMLAAIGAGPGKQGASRSEIEALRVALAKTIEGAPSRPKMLESLLRKIHSVAVSTLDETQHQHDLIGNAIDSRRAGVWSLFEALMGYSKDLSEISQMVKSSNLDLDFLGTSWKRMLEWTRSKDLSKESAALLLGCMRKCLRILSKLATSIDRALVRRTAENLQELLITFSLPPEIVGSAITALAATTISANPESSDKEHRKRCANWIHSVFEACEQEIAACVNETSTVTAPAKLTRILFTLGEVSMIGFHASGDEGSSEMLSSGERQDSTEVSVLRGLKERPNSKLVQLLHAFLPERLPGFSGERTPEELRAHAFTALGKLCLRDDKLAKTSLNILARELYENMNNGSPSVQNNALLVLGDLCVKYTNMVDRFLPVMAACMQSGVTDLATNVLGSSLSSSAMVRKNAVLLLSSLILQDYIKWRGLLFHRFLVASADEDEEVANLSEMIVCGPLITKQPKLFFNHFVESIFVLNRCTAHPIYVAAATMGDSGSGIAVGFEGISLSGEVGRIRRHKMYEMMLAKLTDEDKIGVTARIAKDVLGSALQSGSDLHCACALDIPSSRSTGQESAFNVLSDALVVLSSPMIRVGKTAKEDDDIEDPNVPNASRRVLVAKGKLLSKISRKHLIEIILPILCNLKSILQKNCSRLLKDLMAFLVDVFRRYNTEVKEFLASDPDLLQEIEYDAKQFQKKNQSETPRNVASN